MPCGQWMVVLIAGAAVAGCSSSSSSTGGDAGGDGGSDASTNAITLTGTFGAASSDLRTALVSSELCLVSQAAEDASRSTLLSPSVTPRGCVPSVYSGYVFSCVTFSSPAIGGTATADGSGAFSLTLEARGLPLGCFVIDASGDAVAEVLFSSSEADGGADGGASVVGAQFSSGDAALGTILIDAETGVATASLPSSGATPISSTPSGTACPVGTWSLTTTGVTCGGTATGSATVFAGDGGYWFSVIETNSEGETKIYPRIDMTSTDAGFQAAMAVEACDGGTDKVKALTLTVADLDADGGCTQMTGSAVLQTCGGCDCCGDDTVTLVKQ